MKITGSYIVGRLGRVLAMSVWLFAAPTAMAADPVVEGGDLSRGAQTWVNNCARCHNARDPKEFRDDQWRPIAFHMRIRAGLTGQQTRDVLKFLQESN